MVSNRLRFEVRTDSRIDEPDDRAYSGGHSWPTPAYHVIVGDRSGYRIEVECVLDEPTGAPVVVGLTVRRLRRLEREPTDWPVRGRFKLRRSKASKNGELLFADRLRPLSLRDVRRLPLPTFVEKARVLAGTWFQVQRSGSTSWPPEDLPDRLRRARPPSGKPVHGHAGGWMEKLAAAYKAEAAKGVQYPGAALAHRMNVPPDLMRTWVYRMRDRGLLPPADDS